MPRDVHLALSQEARDYLQTLPIRDRSRLVSDLLLCHKKHRLHDFPAVQKLIEEVEVRMAVLKTVVDVALRNKGGK